MSVSTLTAELKLFIDCTFIVKLESPSTHPESQLQWRRTLIQMWRQTLFAVLLVSVLRPNITYIYDLSGGLVMNLPPDHSER